MANSNKQDPKLVKQAANLAIKVDARWSDETIQRKINEAGDVPEPDGEGVPKSEDQHVSPDHWPAQSEETSNAHGEEVEADTVAEQKNEDGRTNAVDFVKNTGPGPGNPGERHTDPRTLTEAQPVRVEYVADKPRDDKGNELKTEETPKVIHETVAASGNREIDNNIIPDQNARPFLVRKANELNIRVDPEWENDRLRAEIQAALEGRADWQVTGAVPPKEYGKVDFDAATQSEKRNTPIALTNDYWEDDGEGGTRRVVADSEEGQNYKTTRAEAEKLLKAGKAKRNDPLPG